MAAPLEFVMLYEYNYKENELFIFYLQWTGNEEALKKLHKIISKAFFDDMYGDFSLPTLNIKTKIPESAVDIHCQASDVIDPNCFHKLFTKCTGTFHYPFEDEDLEREEFELAQLIDSVLYSCKIERLFR